MVAPTRVGWTSGTNAGGSTVALSNPAGAQGGDRITAFLSATGAAATITNLQGWTLLSTLTFNTRRWHILERDYAASYAPLTLSTGEGELWATTATRASSGYVLGATTLGATWRRVDNGGSINTTQAPSMTAPANALALAFFSETSTAAEVEAGTTLAGSGWVKWFWSKAAAGDANPINYLAYAEPAAGATGVATTTWANNSNNGAGVQLVIPQTATGPAPTGTLDTIGTFQNTASTLTVGARQLTTGTVQAVLRLEGAEVDRKTLTFTSGRGNVTFTGLAAGQDYTISFEVDGVVQTDAVAAGRTLRSGASSFTAVSGSCMLSGSTHPIFDHIAAGNHDFWTVQGDATYADPTTLAAWWDGMTQALNAWRGLPRKLVTRWTPDNHDTIRTTPLGGGAPALPPAYKQLAGTSGFASSDSVGQAWQNGRVLFIQADLRSARDNYQTDAAPLTMLGATQTAWFKGLLQSAEADPTIALVVWFDNWIGLQQGSGRWGSYPHAYAELNSTIQALPWVREHLVLIGGDSHNLWADSGARSWPEAAFPGIPSLNISGYNRASPAETFYVPDIANDTLIASGAEADWGGYSRMTVTDSGSSLTFLWEAVRVNAAGAADVMASWSKTVSENVDRTAVGTITVTGSAPRTIDTARTSTGTVAVTSGATRTVGTVRTSTGVADITGLATRTIDTARTATGSILVGGAGQLEGGSIIRTATGFITIDGYSTRTIDVARSAAGVVQVVGVASRVMDVVRTAPGQVVVTGIGTIAHEPSPVPDNRTLNEIPIRHTLTPGIITHTLEDA